MVRMMKIVSMVLLMCFSSRIFSQKTLHNGILMKTGLAAGMTFNHPEAAGMGGSMRTGMFAGVQTTISATSRFSFKAQFLYAQSGISMYAMDEAPGRRIHVNLHEFMAPLLIVYNPFRKWYVEGGVYGSLLVDAVSDASVEGRENEFSLFRPRLAGWILGTSFTIAPMLDAGVGYRQMITPLLRQGLSGMVFTTSGSRSFIQLSLSLTVK